jgi:UDP-2,3-diacylglucosamine pyrophosphatase LpxH
MEIQMETQKNTDASVTNHRWRSIFISDTHLGTRGCKSTLLLDFLKHNDSDNLYLVGDIIDGWRIKRSRYWPQEHSDVVQKILRKVRKGTRRHSST